MGNRSFCMSARNTVSLVMVNCRTLFLSTVLIVIGFSATKADPLTFSNVRAQQNGTTVDLFSNPGTTLGGPTITFFVDINGTLPPGATDTLLITLQETGKSPISQSFQI